MARTTGEAREQLLDRLARLVHERFPAEHSALAERFVRLYYGWARFEVLESRDPIDLCGAALTHLALARRRVPRETLIRVFGPTLEEDGWECPHTVIEIVTEDMPFLVDSVRIELNRRGLNVLGIIHPIMRLRRDAAGTLTEVLERGSSEEGAVREALMHVEIVRQTDPLRLREIESDLRRVLGDVRRAVEDWRPMRDAVARVVAEIEARPPPADDVDESLAFLRWLAQDHFTFLGYRAYDLVDEDGEVVLRIVAGSGLGVLREQADSAESRAFGSLPSRLRAQAREPALLILSKANARATVHRAANLDYIGVKRFDADGRVCGEHRFLGLYGSRAYSRLPQEIPILRNKIARVMERADLEPTSHSGKALTHILETYPRDELFQIGEDELFEIVTGIMQLAEEQRPRMFLREDPYGRFITCLVYTPRDRYDSHVRERMQRIFQESFDAAEVEFSVSISEASLARILFVARTRPGKVPRYDSREIEARLREAILSWADRLLAALIEHLGEERGSALFQLYGDAFPAGYREDFPAREAVRDLEHMEQLDPEHRLGLSLYTPLEAGPGRLRFKVFRYARPLPLSLALPMLENMGVEVEDERPYRIDRAAGPALWVQDFGLAYQGDVAADGARLHELFQDTFAMVWRGTVENDEFNRLVMKAGLDWRQAALVRAYARYLQQTGIAFSQSYMARAAAANPKIVARLVRLFEVRFDPHRQHHAARQAARLITQIQEALDEVESLDHDRILRSFLAVQQATVRTNWYQRDADGGPKPYVALKLLPEQIPDLPEPRPAFEIFVYSPRAEGVHLRGGKVARGGLRWSDRLEDFRTEVLGLMKAQMVKNAIIVPVGAKGGFVVKQSPAERSDLRAEVLACYRQFISGLLDLTDNLGQDRFVPPPDLVRYDEDDPYLVVAADKGTASLSDTANEIAARYGYWLGDAFASGGASGYDHKKMGITARGAWECVKQHFSTAGIDYEGETFTVAGIGDMSGDVFGNGMLLSRRIKLVAAFDHRHIFIDPDPDPALSFAERRRLFDLPGSSWDDYDRGRISAGGGVYPRSLKTIRLSEQARAALDIRSDSFTPGDLIRVLLRAPVDLLWNGGIGTYVRARQERDGDVGDRGNDAVRVTADSLRCRVVGEGGNLGLTQLARIEMARNGVRLDTDFVHNAGGVSCSDHEVNIKILLDRVVAEGDLTLKQRNGLLEEMTGEVTRLVLGDCYWQSRAIGLDEHRARDMLAEHGRFIRALEQSGRINRGLEYLPDEEGLKERAAAGEGLTRPEIALLVSYAKHTLYEELLASDIPEDPCLAPELERYFPTPLRDRFRERIHSHRLRREILGGSLANRLVNRVGCSFVFRLQEDLGVSATAVVRAYLVVWEVFGLRRLWTAVSRLDGEVVDALQRQMLESGSRLMARGTRWLLKNVRGRIDVAGSIGRYREGVAELDVHLPELMDPTNRAAMEARATPFQEAGVPADLALWVAGFDTLSRALDIVEVAADCQVSVSDAAGLYFALGDTLDLAWLARQIGALSTRDRWLSGARGGLRDELLEHHRVLSRTVLLEGMTSTSAVSRLEAWKHQYHGAVQDWLRLLAELRLYEKPDVARLSVALRALEKLTLTARAS